MAPLNLLHTDSLTLIFGGIEIIDKRNLTLSAFVLLLVAAVVCYGSGCASLKRLTYSKQERLMFDSFRSQVHEAVSDPLRAEQLIELGENLAVELNDYFKKMAKMVKKCLRANADYDAPPEQLTSNFLALDEHRRKMRETLLRAHAQSVMLTTDSEWRRLSSRKNTLQDFIEKHPELF